MVASYSQEQVRLLWTGKYGAKIRILRSKHCALGQIHMKTSAARAQAARQVQTAHEIFLPHAHPSALLKQGAPHTCISLRIWTEFSARSTSLFIAGSSTNGWSIKENLWCNCASSAGINITTFVQRVARKALLPACFKMRSPLHTHLALSSWGSRF
jgi:hypothetical protein